MTTEDFIKKAINLYGNQFDYSKTKYIHSKQPVIIICQKHGEFLQRPNDHLCGKNCNSCGKDKKTKKLSKFIKEAIEIHGRFYNYSSVNYLNAETKIKIICPEHGLFSQLPKGHLAGYGCYECSRFKSGIINIDNIINNPVLGNRNAVLYFVKFQNESEEFYKIGYTTSRIKQRFNKVKKYNIDIIKFKNTTLRDAIIEEHKFKTDFRQFKYIPNHKFEGWTECFKKTIYKEMFPS